MGAVISQATYPPFIFSLIIGIPSMILYMIEVFVLFANASNFRSAFYWLFIARFISNFINYFCSYFYIRLGRLGLFIGLFQAMPPQFLAVFFFFNYYTFHADNLPTMFILLNRLTLILVPIGQEKIWKYLLPVSILATHLAPLAWTVQVLTYEFHVRLQNDNVTFTLYIQPNPNRTYIASAYVAAVSALLFGVICGVLNIVTVVLFRRTRGTQANVDKASSVEQKVESRLTIYALVTFLSQLSMAVYYVLTYIASWLFQIGFQLFLEYCQPILLGTRLEQHCPSGLVFTLGKLRSQRTCLFNAHTKVQEKER